jgi:hypothetical protein
MNGGGFYTYLWIRFVFLMLILLLVASHRKSLSQYHTHRRPRRHLTPSPDVVTQISPFHSPAAESCNDWFGGHQRNTRKETYMSKYAIERASSPNDSSGSMTVFIRINNRRIDDGSAKPSPSLGRDRVVVGVSGRFVAHGVFGMGECSTTCRSIPAVAMSGSTGWISVVLTIDR